MKKGDGKINWFGLILLAVMGMFIYMSWGTDNIWAMVGGLVFSVSAAIQAAIWNRRHGY